MGRSLSKDQRGTPTLALARSWDFHSESDPPNPLEPLASVAVPIPPAPGANVSGFLGFTAATF